MTRRQPKNRKGRCVLCGREFVARMLEWGGSIPNAPCPFCGADPCHMTYLAVHVKEVGEMELEEALAYAITLETQAEVELVIKEEIRIRREHARHELLQTLQDQYRYLDELGVTEYYDHLPPTELIAYHLPKWPKEVTNV